MFCQLFRYGVENASPEFHTDLVIIETHAEYNTLSILYDGDLDVIGTYDFDDIDICISEDAHTNGLFDSLKYIGKVKAPKKTGGYLVFELPKARIPLYFMNEGMPIAHLDDFSSLSISTEGRDDAITVFLSFYPSENMNIDSLENLMHYNNLQLDCGTSVELWLNDLGIQSIMDYSTTYKLIEITFFGTWLPKHKKVNYVLEGF